MPAEDLHGRAVGVDRLQPGDHAFFAYADDETRWEILTVFTQQGFARDEKVGLLVDVDHSADWVADRVAGGGGGRAPGAARRAARRVERAAGSRAAGSTPRGWWRGRGAGSTPCSPRGISGLRSASEMSLALAPIDHLGQAVEYEIALHASLFSARAARPAYTALCYWDERLFGGTDAMDAARSVHPVIVLPRLGTLHAAVAGNRLSLTGDSDLASRTEFDAALRSLAGLARDHAGARHHRPVVLRRAQRGRRAAARGGADRAAAARGALPRARSGGCCTCSAAGRSSSCRSSPCGCRARQ